MLGFNFDAHKQMLKNLGKELDRLDRAIEEKKQTRDRLNTAPARREDVKAQVGANLKKHGERYPKLLARTLDVFKVRPFHDLGSGRLDLIGQNGPPGTTPAEYIPKVNACYLLADVIEKRICDAIDEMPWPADHECGPPLDERRKLIAKLDKEIDELEKQQTELKEQARQAGIRL